jgi:hypothetical protein
MTLTLTLTLTPTRTLTLAPALTLTLTSCCCATRWVCYSTRGRPSTSSGTESLTRSRHVT